MAASSRNGLSARSCAAQVSNSEYVPMRAWSCSQHMISFLAAPADKAISAACSRQISEPAERIGHRLAAAGVLGRFAIDFVVVKDPTGAWSAYAIELNLRKGGTTHPFLTLQFLTDGNYDGTSGRFLTQQGEGKHLVRTDNL